MTTPSRPPSAFGRFFAEMKRRHVVRFAIGYAAAAFVILQLAEIVFPAFGVEEMGLRVLVVAVGLLFPPALVLAWIFDITSTGIERTEELSGPAADRRPGHLIPRVALLVFTLLMVGGIATWMAGRGVLDDPAPTPTARRDRRPPSPELVAYDPGAPIRSLAVLPLENFTESGAQDYFSAGMHEELIAQLSQIAGLRVVSRTSVLRYVGTSEPIPRIGQDLQVDAVIEGSIRREDDRVRITVQLIHAASDTHVWTQQYDRALGDVLALQGEVALDIAKQVQAELSPEETTLLQRTATRDVDPEAQDAYLRGKFEAEKGTSAGYRTAMGLFEDAVAMDSTFAPALAGLAGTRVLLGMSEDSASLPGEIERARAEAVNALRMDSTSVEARDVLNVIDRSLPRIRPAVGTPVAPITGPDLDTAWVATTSQMGTKIAEQARRHPADGPRDDRIARILAARQLMASARFPDAVQMLSNVVEEDPSLGVAWEFMARAQMSAGNPGGAVDAVEGWSTRGGDGAPSNAEVSALRSAVEREGPAGYWQWSLDRMNARRTAGKPISLTDYAAAQLGAGDSKGAMASLEQALEHRDRGLASLQTDPVWDPLRSDSRFTEIARAARDLRWATSRHSGREPAGATPR